jgi:hypothetical protein
VAGGLLALQKRADVREGKIGKVAEPRSECIGRPKSNWPCNLRARARAD